MTPMTTTPPFPASTGSVLVASPSTSFRAQVRQSFDDRPWAVQEAQGGAEALVKLASGQWQLLLLDRRLPDLDAEELIEIIKLRFPGIEVVMVDSDSDAPAVTRCSATKTGHASPWFRPCSEIPASPQKPADAGLSSEETKTHPRVAPLPGMIGDSEAMQHLYQLTRLVAPRDTTVLVMGATGTGKELVARAVHQLSPRSAKPLVVVNCAAIPESLLESELFGYARGAFTGAVQTYMGRIQLAQGGTLFLDEIGELPLSLQAKLLRFLDFKEVQRLGSADVLKVDVRVVAATNRNLGWYVEQARFREDLFYRLSAFPLHLPALAERCEDILPLARHFLRSLAGNRQPPSLTAEAGQRLQSHRWSGNVRELQLVIERAAILAEGSSQILPAHLYFASEPGSQFGEGLAIRQPNGEEISYRQRGGSAFAMQR